jgi:DNA-binding Lrp family transcriptional regulator
VDLAGLLHADPKVIRYHINRLEKQGVIAGYTLAVDYLKFEAERVELHLSLKHHGLVGQIIDFFDEMRTCTYAYELLGNDDLSLELYVEDDEQLRLILRRFRERFGDDYISYGLTRIYEEHLSNWSPLEAE